jgi:hypothetical protein
VQVIENSRHSPYLGLDVTAAPQIAKTNDGLNPI